MTTVWESVHSSSMNRVGAATWSPCAKCTNPVERGGLGLKACQHEIGVFELDRANEQEILNALTHESMTNGVDIVSLS